MFNKIALKKGILTLFAVLFVGVSGASASIDTRLIGEPTCQIAFSENNLHTGSHVTELHWDSQNATWATIDTIGSVPLHGARSLHMNTTRTYTMTVGNAQGKTATCTALLRVAGDELTPSCSINVSPRIINGVGHAELYWDTKDADYIAIDNGIGVISKYKSGYIIVSPNKTTKYTMTVRDEETGATHYCATTLTVQDNGVYYFNNSSYQTNGYQYAYDAQMMYNYSVPQTQRYYYITGAKYKYRTAQHHLRMNTIPYTGANDSIYVLLLTFMAFASFYGVTKIRKVIG